MKQITECRVCKNQEIKEFLDLGDQPPANSLLKNAEEKEEVYPLSLSWCPNCNLVQLNHTLDPEDLFTEYVWVTETSQVAKVHAKSFYENITKRVENPEGSFVLEVASNDGTFLVPFIENNYKVLGVDPAKNIANIANERGIPTQAKFFGEEVAKEILEEHGPSKIIFARNVIPHVANLHDVIKGLSVCLDEKGILAIEAHYAKIILEELHYDSIYHEHLGYFTLKSMEALLNQFGLYVVDIEKSPISGGSLIYYIKKKQIENITVREQRNKEVETKLNDLESWQDFTRKTYGHKEKLLEILDQMKQEGKRIIGYGASARSSTLLNFCRIGPKQVPIIADQNPLKHNKYTAGTHIPIKSPEIVMETNPNCVFMLAWNFTNEISEILKTKYGFQGKCIIPLPNDPKIIDI